MLSDLLCSALEVLHSGPEDIWYDGIECMLSARFPQHIGDPKEGLQGYWYQPLPKAPCHWNNVSVLLACTENAQKSGGVPWTAVEIQVNILSILTAPDAQRKSIRNTASMGWKTFQKASNEIVGESWGSLYPGHTFQRAQWAAVIPEVDLVTISWADGKCHVL